MNEIARNFLETYASGREVEGGWRFAKALRQVQLDYSDAGLSRLDQLLTAVRERAKPSLLICRNRYQAETSVH